MGFFRRPVYDISVNGVVAERVFRKKAKNLNDDVRLCMRWVCYFCLAVPN